MGLTRAIVDTGSCSTIIDASLARALGLTIHEARGSEWGTFQGTGGAPQAYAGVIMGPVRVTLSDAVSVDIPFMRVFNHSYPLALLGADVLKP